MLTSIILLPFLAALVLLQQRVEVGHHLPESEAALRRGHAADAVREVAELLVDHVALKAVLDALEGLAGLGRSPVVGGELLHGPSDVVGNVVEEGLAEPRVVGGVGEQRGPLGGEGLVEEVAQVVEQAVHAA